MNKINEKYELTHAELRFLDGLIAKMLPVPKNIEEQLKGSKDFLRNQCEIMLEGILEESCKPIPGIKQKDGEPDLPSPYQVERIATTEKVKLYSRYMADKLYKKVNK